MKIKRKLKRKTDTKYCECGCGQEVKQGNRFVYSHQNIGRNLSEEHKRKISISSKGRKLPPFSKKHRQKLSESRKGKYGINASMFGKKHSKETKLKISLALKGKKQSKETILKMSKAHEGKKHTEETKLKIAMACTRYRTDGYCDIWCDLEYRQDCKKDYCEICGIKEIKEIMKNGRFRSNLGLHHIDFDKKNCSPDNLQTLCKNCHARLHYLNGDTLNQKFQVVKNV